jgi:hypothetical protein
MEKPADLTVSARLLGIAALLAVACAVIAALTPPPALAKDADATEFSAARAIEAMADIVRGPHPTGSPENAATRERLVARLHELKLEVLESTSTACTAFVGSVHCARPRDVVARLPGTRGGSAVALFAHYDSVPNAPGASDDGAGVATLLETARALRASARLANDVMFVFTDAEEVGLVGAETFASDHPWRADVRVALNFEARGSGGVSTMYDASPENGALVRALARTAPRPFTNSLASALARVLPNDTDGSVLKAHGYPVMNFAFIGGFEDYHRATDDVSHLDPRSVQHHGTYALALARELGDEGLGSLRAPDRVWFDLFGYLIVSYPPWVGALMTIAALALFAMAIARGRRAGSASLKGVGAGLGFAAAALVLSTLGAVGLSTFLSRVGRWEVLLAHPALVFAPYATLVSALVIGVLARALRRRTPLELASGAAAPWLIGALATAILAPAAGFLFHVPALFTSAGLFFLTGSHTTARRFALLCAASVPTVCIVTELAFSLLLMTGAAAPVPASVAVALLLLLSWGPLAVALPSLRRWRVPAGLLACAFVLAVVAAISVRRDRSQPVRDFIGYALDASTGAATWLAWGSDAYTRPMLGSSPKFAAAPTFARSDEFWQGPAPAIALSAPVAEIVRDETHGDRRIITLRARSTRAAPRLTLWDASGAAIRAIRVDDRAPLAVSHFSPETDRRLYTMFIGPLSPLWAIELYGGQSEGFVLELEMPAGAHPEIHVVDRSYGLPPSAVQGIREPLLIPWEWSDTTLVAGTVLTP